MEKEDNKITDSDLRKQKYPMEILIKNIDHLSISTLLRWQRLDADFCIKYILNEDYQSVEEKYKVTSEYILKRQPHLTHQDLEKNVNIL